MRTLSVLIVFAIMMVLTAAAARAAPCDLNIYQLAQPGQVSVETRAIPQPFQRVDTMRWDIAGLVFVATEGQRRVNPPPDDPTCGDGTHPTFPTDTDQDVWSDPTNPTGDIPCEYPTDPNFPGDQPPYVDLPDQPWAF